jgi:hypothetical protein
LDLTGSADRVLQLFSRLKNKRILRELAEKHFISASTFSESSRPFKDHLATLPTEELEALSSAPEIGTNHRASPAPQSGH